MNDKTKNIIIWIISALLLSLTILFGLICINRDYKYTGFCIIILSIIAAVLIFLNTRLGYFDDFSDIEEIDYKFNSNALIGLANIKAIPVIVKVSDFLIDLEFNDEHHEYTLKDVSFIEKDNNGYLILNVPVLNQIKLKFDRKLKEQAFLASL